LGMQRSGIDGLTGLPRHANDASLVNLKFIKQ